MVPRTNHEHNHGVDRACTCCPCKGFEVFAEKSMMGESQGWGRMGILRPGMQLLGYKSFMAEMGSEDFMMRAGGAKRLKAGQER